MKRFYSKTTQTTYLKGVHTTIPADAVEISEESYLEVIGNPAPNKIRVHDEQGFPYLIDAPIVEEDMATVERKWRDSEMASIIWQRERHRDQLEIDTDTTLSGEQFSELLAYLQALRDWPQSANFPEPHSRPVAPPWVAEQTQ